MDARTLRRLVEIAFAFTLGFGLLAGAGCNAALGIDEPTVQDSGNAPPDVSMPFDGSTGGQDSGEASSPGSNRDSATADAARSTDVATVDAGDTSIADSGELRRDVGNDTPGDSAPTVDERDALQGGGEAAAADAGATETSVGDSGTSDAGFACGTPPCTPVLLLSQDAGYTPVYLAQDDTYLFWTQPTNGGIVGRTHKITGETVVLFETNGAQGIATDDAAVYWVARPPNVVNRCPKSGCDGGMTTPATTGALSRGIALDDRNVYWTDISELTVRAVPKSGGDGGLTTLWQSDAATPNEIAIDGQRLYVTGNDGKLYLVGLDGGVISSLGVAGPSAALGVALDDRAVYWIVSGVNGTVFVASKTMLTPVPLASNQLMPNFVAIEGASIYWTNFGTSGLTGSVMTCPVASCSTPTVLVRGIPAPRGLAVDSKSVYWSDNAAIWKVDK